MRFDPSYHRRKRDVEEDDEDNGEDADQEAAKKNGEEKAGGEEGQTAKLNMLQKLQAKGQNEKENEQQCHQYEKKKKNERRGDVDAGLCYAAIALASIASSCWLPR